MNHEAPSQLSAIRFHQSLEVVRHVLRNYRTCIPLGTFGAAHCPLGYKKGVLSADEPHHSVSVCVLSSRDVESTVVSQMHVGILLQ